MENIVLRPYQQECVDLIDSLDGGRYLIDLCMGLGKCLGRGTPVIMYDGATKKVEDIVSGDRLLGPDGQPRLVDGVVAGWSRLYKIHQSRGMSYVVNDSHIISLWKENRIINMEIEDFLAIPVSEQNSYFGWKASPFRDYPFKETFMDPFTAGKRAFSHRQRFHPDFLYNDRHARQQFLSGIIYANGTAEPGSVSLPCPQGNAMHDLSMLCRGLGLYIQFFKESMSISGDLSFLEGMFIADTGVPYSRLWVEDAGFGDYYGFSLKGNDRLFLLADGTVTHNTVIASSI